MFFARRGAANFKILPIKTKNAEEKIPPHFFKIN